MATSIVINKTCNPQLLQDILSKYFNKKIVVTKTETDPATVKGHNFVSDAWRVKIVYKEDGKDETINDTVIIKTKRENEEVNKLMHSSTAFANEMYAYEKVIPALNEYASGPLRVPKYYHGDEASIVLEDMNKRSFNTPYKKLSVQWSQVWSPIQEMAKLHAASIVMKKCDPAKFEQLVKGIQRVSTTESTPLGDRQATVIDTIISVLEKYESVEADKYKVVIESLRRGVWKEQQEIINKDVPIRVITHGSIWTNNLLFRGEMITLLDWQHIVYSTPAADLSYFLYVNTDTDFLSNKRKQLIDFYLLNLHQSIYDSAVKRMDVDEVEALLAPLDYEWIESELKRCSLYGYMMSQWISPVFYCSEASFAHLEKIGGFEKMSVKERLHNMTPDEKDRVVKLTREYVVENKQ